MFAMGLFHLSNMDLSLDTKRGKQKVGRILLYVTMQLVRNWIDMAFHSVDFFSYVAALPSSPILQKRPHAQTTIQVPSLVGKTNLFTLFS